MGSRLQAQGSWVIVSAERSARTTRGWLVPSRPIAMDEPSARRVTRQAPGSARSGHREAAGPDSTCSASDGGVRASCSPTTTSVGVRTFPTSDSGDRFQ